MVLRKRSRQIARGFVGNARDARRRPRDDKNTRARLDRCQRKRRRGAAYRSITPSGSGASNPSTVTRRPRFWENSATRNAWLGRTLARSSSASWCEWRLPVSPEGDVVVSLGEGEGEIGQHDGFERCQHKRICRRTESRWNEPGNKQRQPNPERDKDDRK